MAGARRAKMNGGGIESQKVSGRPMPKRGQVKARIVLGLAHSVAVIFSISAGRRRCAAPRF